jgi:hypothetical protein
VFSGLQGEPSASFVSDPAMTLLNCGGIHQCISPDPGRYIAPKAVASLRIEASDQTPWVKTTLPFEHRSSAKDLALRQDVVSLC